MRAFLYYITFVTMGPFLFIMLLYEMFGGDKRKGCGSPVMGFVESGNSFDTEQEEGGAAHKTLSQRIATAAWILLMVAAGVYLWVRCGGWDYCVSQFSLFRD